MVSLGVIKIIVTMLGSMLSPVMMDVIKTIFIMVSFIMLSGIMLSFIIMSYIMMSFKTQSGITLC
jgi:hypothetical protein